MGKPDFRWETTSYFVTEAFQNLEQPWGIRLRQNGTQSRIGLEGIDFFDEVRHRRLVDRGKTQAIEQSVQCAVRCEQKVRETDAEPIGDAEPVASRPFQSMKTKKLAPWGKGQVF